MAPRNWPALRLSKRHCWTPLYLTCGQVFFFTGSAIAWHGRISRTRKKEHLITGYIPLDPPWLAESSWIPNHPTSFHSQAAVSMLFHKHYVQERKKIQHSWYVEKLLSRLWKRENPKQIRQKLYVRIGFGQKIIVYNLLVRVNNDTKAWKKVIYIKQPTTTDWRKPWSKLNSVWFIGFKFLRKTLIVM